MHCIIKKKRRRTCNKSLQPSSLRRAFLSISSMAHITKENYCAGYSSTFWRCLGVENKCAKKQWLAHPVFGGYNHHTGTSPLSTIRFPLQISRSPAFLAETDKAASSANHWSDRWSTSGLESGFAHKGWEKDFGSVCAHFHVGILDYGNGSSSLGS